MGRGREGMREQRGMMMNGVDEEEKREARKGSEAF